MTPQRRLVLEAVAALGHATPDSVHERVAEHGVNLSTVYRSLDRLEAVGLVVHTHLGQGAPVYHLADRADHLHLVCLTCGAVSDAPITMAAQLVAEVAGATGFVVDPRHMALTGLCGTCHGAANAERDASAGVPDPAVAAQTTDPARSEPSAPADPAPQSAPAVAAQPTDPARSEPSDAAVVASPTDPAAAAPTVDDPTADRSESKDSR
jgi:Fur family ferric uptake transcriptional regulator